MSPEALFAFGALVGAGVAMACDKVALWWSVRSMDESLARAVDARASSLPAYRVITDVDGHEVPVTALDVRTLAAMETYLDALDAKQSRGIKH